MSSYKVYNYYSGIHLNEFLFENIEALAQSEQPDVNDCISSSVSDCEALHPIDPSKDKVRPNAVWPGRG